MENSTLKQKSMNGFKWAIIDNIANQGITFLVGIVLANLLSPAEFGVIAIITIFINLSTTIIDGGFVTALIRKNDASEKDYNTVFYSNLAISIVLMVLLIVGAPFVATFFRQAQLAHLMPVMSVLLIINAFSLIPKTQFVKRIDFKRQALASLIASLTSGTLGIALALKGMGVWSLVCQQISRQFMLTVCFWLFNSWRPRLIFSYKSFQDLFGFGSRLLAANLINTIFKDAFVIIIGKIYTPKALGFYNRADQFNLIISNNLAQVIQRVTMPGLSLVQEDKEQLRHVFSKYIMYSAMLSFMFAFGLAAIAKPLVLTLINEQWLPCVHMLQIMTLYGAIYPLQQLNLNILSVTKHSDYFLRLEVIKKMLFIPVIVIGFYFNVEGMLWGAVAYYYVEFTLNSWYSHRLAGYGTMQQFIDLLPLYCTTLIIAAIVWSVTLLPIAAPLMLCIQIPMAMLLYAGAYFTLYKEELMAVLHMIKK